MSGSSNQLLNRVVVVLGIALIVASVMALAAHDGQGRDAQAEQADTQAKALDEVQITDFVFVPATISVPSGTKIAFTNEDRAPHTATSGASPNADGVFDTGTLTKGRSKSVKVTKAGTFAYYCALHPFMKATVIVT